MHLKKGISFLLFSEIYPIMMEFSNCILPTTFKPAQQKNLFEDDLVKFSQNKNSYYFRLGSFIVLLKNQSADRI